jgi:hypothetical protein
MRGGRFSMPKNKKGEQFLCKHNIKFNTSPTQTSASWKSSPSQANLTFPPRTAPRCLDMLRRGTRFQGIARGARNAHSKGKTFIRNNAFVIVFI